MNAGRDRRLSWSVVALLVAAAVLAGYAVSNARRGPDQRQVASSAARPVAAQTPSAAGMDEAAFWQLTADTRAAASGDTGRQSGLLEKRLRQLPPASIAAFQRIRHRLEERLYTWRIWGAAYVIEDGCSDDCFRDFRAYVLSLGQRPYQTAVRDPDALAPVVQDAEQGDWENADSVAGDAYQAVTGDDIPADDSDLSGAPRGQPWDDDQEEALVSRYPRLAARFR
jgi:hypothetical protein